MKYRYVEFTDGIFGKDGDLWFVGRPSDELIIELGLDPELNYDGSTRGYTTTLQRMAEAGWELQFVTPCGIYLKSVNMSGPVENSYIFRKEV